MSNDRTVLVTGGNRGIGLCKGLTDRGLNVVLGARNEDKGKGAVASIRGRGGSVRVESWFLKTVRHFSGSGKRTCWSSDAPSARDRPW